VAEARILQIAVTWADQHPGDSIGRWGWTPKGGERSIRIGGEGTPQVAEFCTAELAVSLEVHPLGARSLIADALDLRHRLPALWHYATVTLTLPDWVARKIARTTRDLTGAQIATVDSRLAEVAETLPPSRLLTLVEAMVLAATDEAVDADRQERLDRRFVAFNDGNRWVGPRELPSVFARLSVEDAARLRATINTLAGRLAAAGDTDPVEVRRSKALGLLATPALAQHLLDGAPDTNTWDRHAPHATLYLHLTETGFTRDEGGVARFEQGGPITLAHAREILGHSHVTIRPVLDLTASRPTDAYEFTGSLREAVLLRTPADCYPHAVGTGRGVDLDHTDPFDDSEPPGQAGQTEPGNGGPMVRHHHRIKTHGPMTVRQPAPGLYVWRTPHGRYRATDHRGTHRVKPVIGEGIYSPSAGERGLATILLTHT